MKICPLFARSPLFRVSVKRDFTVQSTNAAYSDKTVVVIMYVCSCKPPVQCAVATTMGTYIYHVGMYIITVIHYSTLQPTKAVVGIHQLAWLFHVVNHDNQDKS